MTVGRIRCLVPGCRRTSQNPAGHREFICGKHWRGVPKRLRNRKNLVTRLVRRELKRCPAMSTWWHLPPGSADRIRAVRMFRLADQVWGECRKAAIDEAFMGITV